MDLITSLQMLAPNLAKHIPLLKNHATIFEHTMFLVSTDGL